MADYYQSIDSLMAAHEPCRQESRARPGGSWLTVAAPHAGTIEEHTGTIAKAVAGKDYNLFVFEGLLPKKEAVRLHVTSTNFRVPDLTELQSKSLVTLSVHGLKDRDLGSFTIVGGLNRKLGKIIVRSLRANHFKAYDPFEDKDMPAVLQPFTAANPENFVNKTRLQGVQLEISVSQRKTIAEEKIELSHPFISAIREGLREFESSYLIKEHNE